MTLRYQVVIIIGTHDLQRPYNSLRAKHDQRPKALKVDGGFQDCGTQWHLEIIILWESPSSESNRSWASQENSSTWCVPLLRFPPCHGPVTDCVSRDIWTNAKPICTVLPFTPIGPLPAAFPSKLFYPRHIARSACFRIIVFITLIMFRNEKKNQYAGRYANVCCSPVSFFRASWLISGIQLV